MWPNEDLNNRFLECPVIILFIKNLFPSTDTPSYFIMKTCILWTNDRVILKHTRNHIQNNRSPWSNSYNSLPCLIESSCVDTAMNYLQGSRTINSLHRCMRAKRHTLGLPCLQGIPEVFGIGGVSSRVPRTLPSWILRSSWGGPTQPGLNQEAKGCYFRYSRHQWILPKVILHPRCSRMRLTLSLGGRGGGEKRGLGEGILDKSFTKR